MSVYRRNILVGVVVLGSLVMLGWMIIRFGGSLGELFGGETVPVAFVSSRADGLSEGSAVFYRGVSVGRVVSVTLDGSKSDVMIKAAVDKDKNVPADVSAVIRQTSLLGSGSAIVLTANSDAPGGPELEPEQKIAATFAGLDLFPPEIGNLTKELADLAKKIRDEKLVENINQQVTRAGNLIENADKLVGDPRMRTDLLASVENVRKTTDRAAKLMEDVAKFTSKLDGITDKSSKALDTSQAAIEDLARQSKAQLVEVAKLLQEANAITAKINAGQGTAGQLINDPKLYRNLVDTSELLTVTVKDLDRLLKQWEQEGVSLKLR